MEARPTCSARLSELLAPGGPIETEARRERTPAELLSWVDQTHRDLASSEEDRKWLRLEDGLVKLLLEEVRPLALFGIWLAQKHPQLTVQPTVSKEQERDGTLRSPDWPISRQVEVTVAKDGYHENLRMMHLNRFHRAPANGKISFIRSGGRPRPVITPTRMRAANETRTEIYRLVRGAAENKLRKAYTRDTWLLIAFDDHIGFPRPDAVSEFEKFFKEEVLSLPWQIDGVFAVGMSGQRVAGSRIAGAA
jgi:hypothetical protein